MNEAIDYVSLPLELILSGKVNFDCIRIWNSKFENDVWDYRTASANGRGVVANTINWLRYERRNQQKNNGWFISPSILNSIKVATIVYAYYPALFQQSKNNGVVDPRTVTGRTNELLNFYAFVSFEKLKLGEVVEELSDISFDCLKKFIPFYKGRSSHLRRALLTIYDPIVLASIGEPIEVSQLDIKSKSIRWAPLVPHKGIKTLSDSQFLTILNHSRDAVANFNSAMGIEMNEPVAGKYTIHKFCNKYPFFDEAVSRKFIRLPDDKKFFGRLSYNKRDVNRIVADAHLSAITLIFLLTGMRISEGQLVKADCIIKEHGYEFIKSRVVKQRDKDTVFTDLWIVTPLIKDAVNTLQYLAKYVTAEYLFFPLSPKSGNEGFSYTSGGLRVSLKRWIEKIDNNGLFEGWTLTPHQFRETLVYQMAKAEVGLPFISMQLKHFSHRFKSLPNEVTAGYGEYKKNLMSDICNRVPEAREQLLMEVYGEGSNLAGGAAEAHKQRIDTFFVGLGLFGEGRVAYIQKLAMKNVSIMPTSIGGCMRNFMSEVDEQLPCYGDYHCDPDCKNHLISDSCKIALGERHKLAVEKESEASSQQEKDIWGGLSICLKKHIDKLESDHV